MRCIYCDKPIEKINFYNLFLEEDCLCSECRNKLIIDKKYIKIDKLKILTLYNYDGFFRDLLIQYKECYDEALAEVFLYKLKDYIKYKYLGYSILFIPSSENKLLNRGFNHLELIFKGVNMPIINGLKMKIDTVQEGKNLSQRKMMIDNYVYIGNKHKKVLIVDDVLTSGSSMLGAYNAVKPFFEKIELLTLARKENAFIYRNKCVKIKKRRIIRC